MELQLKYKESQGAPAMGAFIPGSSPRDWLTEIGSWKVPLATLRCFVMPASLADNRTSGLFVVFAAKILPDPSKLRHPYRLTADRLFLPVQASLYPPIDTSELKALLLWDLQVFHPVIGLVGFEAKDELQWAQLIQLRQAETTDWSLAHPGIPLPPPLQMIGLETEEAPAEVMEELKAVINPRPLSEIPVTDADENVMAREGKKALNWLSKIGLYLLLFFILLGPVILILLGVCLLVVLFKAGNFPTGGLIPLLVILARVLFNIPGLFSSGGRGAVTTSNQQGIFGRAKQWINQRLEDLEKQRDSELKRLVNLFDQNTDEALRYAIPLSSPYLNRGTAPASGKLGRRSTLFNLGNLGGGRRVDGWDLGDYNLILRQRYEKAANEAIAAGDFKRAAYIYAHLLGNLHSAANVLQQGKLYREAAAIYQDHLKSERMAAECLEKGGLLTEAITLYLKLENPEKAADLYRLLGKETEAIRYYRQKQQSLQAAGEYLQAANLTIDKLHETEEGKAILLQGWKDHKAAEACLERYLDICNDSENGGLSTAVSDIYAKHVPPLKRTSFLNVLAKMSSLHPEEQFQATALHIAYETVSAQAAAGDTGGLKLLSRFVPQDRLLSSDAVRYAQHRLKLPPVLTGPKYWELRKDYHWLSVAPYHDQLLAIGRKDNDLYFIRANWQGKVNYHYLNNLDDTGVPYDLFVDPGLSDCALITSELLDIKAEEKLQADEYFERELWLRSFYNLPGGNLACCLNGAGGVSKLHHDAHELLLSHYDFKGNLLHSHTCKIESDYFQPGQARFNPRAMTWRKNHFYYHQDNLLLRFTFTGEMEFLEFDTPVLSYSLTGQHAALKIAVLTTDNIFLVVPELKKMRVAARFREISAEHICLLTDQRLVVTQQEKASIYNLSGDSPVLQSTIHTANAIQAIIPVPERHHCAFLENDRRISIYDLNNFENN
ncbi:hypothetical protein EOD41_02870 [Mucilaginibacter limnophilus]|uniref:MoxR-vWA-beta-propeller ternary system domain-containing protein n=1 Tax=Mucilaginibacter limnophilus TaxID=1932778 RepID=A0A3S2VAL4_9SPHI|nr:hypothetical protein [Mucilaginibacter limnophilus]RVU02897.1 hypothetical protein EOD41_02870 [Mucilaginibacter limnophilus]